VRCSCHDSAAGPSGSASATVGDLPTNKGYIQDLLVYILGFLPTVMLQLWRLFSLVL